MGVAVFGYGKMTARANGRINIKVEYDTEMQMTRLSLGDEFVELEVFLPTHKLSELLADAFDAQTKDPHAIGQNSWLEERVGGKLVPLKTGV